MHLSTGPAGQNEEAILPLVNLVFLLLIFFMISSRLIEVEPFVVTPPVSQSEGLDEPETITLLMGVDHQFALNNTLLSETQLLQALKTLLQDQPQVEIILKADGHLPANQLVRFTQALHELEVKKLRLLTQPEAL